MSYQALYRQWRPLDFDEVIGQSHITIPLKNQINSNNIGHAYVFSGTRGTGKTSTAKVFARAVNCLNNTDGNPCNQCSNCLSILDEQFIDVIEMDAASNNSVDDIRELREHIKFAPSSGKFKVYIIDEVHMLSSGAFNALLKTLEEPPEYVLFILATTEVHKIPQTILSRCQRFDFKRVSQEDIFSRLAHICKKLEVIYEDEALRLIIRKSDGAVRDSLSSLDQCLSIGGKELTTLGVIEMLGLVEKNVILDLIRYMALGKGGQALTSVHSVLSSGKDVNQFVNAIIEVYRDLLIVKLIHENHHLLINASQEYITTLIELSKPFTEPQISRGLNAFVELSKTIKYAQNQRIVFEATLVKVLHPEVEHTSEALLERVSKLERALKDVLQGNILTKADENSLPIEKQELEENSHVLETSEMTKPVEATNVAGPTSAVEDTQVVETTEMAERMKTAEITDEPQTIDTQASDATTKLSESLHEFSDVDFTEEDVKSVYPDFLKKVNQEKKMIAPVLEGSSIYEVKGQKVSIALKKENQLFIGILESKQNMTYLETQLSNLLKNVVKLHFTVVDQPVTNGTEKQADEEQAIMDFFKDYKDVLEIK